jgi:hypothetical protein
VDFKQQYIEIAGRILAKGCNTDTNCSIVLCCIGAALGYSNTPYYFREKILKSDHKPAPNRPRDYWAGRVVDIVSRLLKEGPIFLDEE